MENAGGDESRFQVPWELPEEPGNPGEPQRRDAFNGARKRKFLRVLQKTGCLRDAARAAGISPQTAYNHQQSDPEFARHCQLALEMAATPVELTVWERAVVGVEEEVIRGGKVVGTRLKRSDSLLRFLLQGANPKKYGPRPGFSRKRLLEHERKQIEREVRARIAAKKPSMEQVRDSILSKLKAISRHEDAQRLADGWTCLDDDIWIPPGWVKVGPDTETGRTPSAEVPRKCDSV